MKDFLAYKFCGCLSSGETVRGDLKKALGVPEELLFPLCPHGNADRVTKQVLKQNSDIRHIWAP